MKLCRCANVIPAPLGPARPKRDQAGTHAPERLLLPLSIAAIALHQQAELTVMAHQEPARSSTAQPTWRGAGADRESTLEGGLGPGLVPIARCASDRRRDDAKGESYS